MFSVPSSPDAAKEYFEWLYQTGELIQRKLIIEMAGLDDSSPGRDDTGHAESIRAGFGDARCSFLDTYGTPSTLHKFTKANSWVTLKPYQKAAVHWLKVLFESGVDGILSDEAGLGKSTIVSTFTSVLVHERKRPIVIFATTGDMHQWSSDLAHTSPHLKVSLRLPASPEENDSDVYLLDLANFDEKLPKSVLASKLNTINPTCVFIVGPEVDACHTILLQKRLIPSIYSCPRFFLLPALPSTLRLNLLPLLTAPSSMNENSFKNILSVTYEAARIEKYSRAISSLILQRSANEIVNAALPASTGNTLYRTSTMNRNNAGSLSIGDLDLSYTEPLRVATIQPKQIEGMSSAFRIDERISAAALAITTKVSKTRLSNSQAAGGLDDEAEIQRLLMVDEDEALMEKYKSGSMGRLFAEGAPYKLSIIVGVISLVGYAVSQLAVNLFVGMLVDELDKPKDEIAVWNVLSYIIGNAGVMAILNFTWMYLLWNTGDKIVCSLRKRLFWSIVNREISFFDRERTGALMSRLAGDVSIVKIALTQELTDFIQRSFTVVIALAYMFYLSWALTLIAASIAPVIGVIGSRLAHYFHSIARKSNDILANANTHAEEAFSSAKTVRSFAQEASIYKSYATLCNMTLSVQMKSNFAKSMQRTFVYFFAMCAITMALWYGGEEVKKDSLSTGNLLSFLLFGVQVGEKTGGTLDNLSQIRAAAGASAKVFMYLDKGTEYMREVVLQNKKLSKNDFEHMSEDKEDNDSHKKAFGSEEDSALLGNSFSQHDNKSNASPVIGKSVVASDRSDVYMTEEGDIKEEDQTEYQARLFEKLKDKKQKLTQKELADIPDVILHTGELVELPIEAILARNAKRKKELAFRRRPRHPIIFENVWFRYPLRPDRDVLRGLNLKLEPGKVVALVGPSGGGKSTIVGLLERFYHPYKGRVSWGGINFKDFDNQWLHRQIGFVGQEPTLLGGTVRDNILFGIRGVEKFDELPQEEQDYWNEKVISAAKSANAHNFITSWPDGYETLVGERGTQVSGGQKQRIAIARAMIIDPPILLLDEATSALDSESEMLVQAALEKLMEGRTTMMIAHRLSTVRNADIVVCLNGGVVAEMGSHDELVSLGGIYAHLVSPQLEEAEREVQTVQQGMIVSNNA